MRGAPSPSTIYKILVLLFSSLLNVYHYITKGVAKKLPGPTLGSCSLLTRQVSSSPDHTWTLPEFSIGLWHS